MNTQKLIEEIKSKLTGDPQKDGPFLKDISDKYRNEENSDEINRELAKLLYESAYNDLEKSVQEYTASENPKVSAKLAEVEKLYDAGNFDEGLDILGEIIRGNVLEWDDTDEITYKSFGTPLEHALYLQIYQPEKQVRPVSCALSEVYSLYGLGLVKKGAYDPAFGAFENAIRFCPTDAEIYIRYSELLKQTGKADELRLASDRVMRCAVNKVQLGKAYFNYSFYYSEKDLFNEAAAMLEMSRIFLGDADEIDNELRFIASKTGSMPEPHSQQQLMAFMLRENIQPGPSALVISTANFLAKRAYTELDFRLSRFYYGVVLELTEDDSIREIVDELDHTIKDIEDEKEKG